MQHFLHFLLFCSSTLVLSGTKSIHIRQEIVLESKVILFDPPSRSGVPGDQGQTLPRSRYRTCTQARNGCAS